VSKTPFTIALNPTPSHVCPGLSVCVLLTGVDAKRPAFPRSPGSAIGDLAPDAARCRLAVLRVRRSDHPKLPFELVTKPPLMVFELSCSLRISMICSSVKRLFRIR
jgi:hypothetical protein